MNVLLDTAVLSIGKIIVDDVHDIANVKTASRDTGSDQDWSLASAESTTRTSQQGLLRGQDSKTYRASSRSRCVRSA